jgi:hypothetical protein
MISALSIPLQVDRGEPEVAVAELALDDDKRHAFARQLDGVRMIAGDRRRPARSSNN